MNKTDIEERVIAAAANRAGIDPDNIRMDSAFRGDLGFDSLAEVEFVIEMEDEFETEIYFEEVEGVETIGQLVELIYHLKVECKRGPALPIPVSGEARPVVCTRCSWRGERIYASDKGCPACGGAVNFR